MKDNKRKRKALTRYHENKRAAKKEKTKESFSNRLPSARRDAQPARIWPHVHAFPFIYLLLHFPFPTRSGSAEE